MDRFTLAIFSLLLAIICFCTTCNDASPITSKQLANWPHSKLVPAPKLECNDFVDCNMAEAWIADTFRIFSGKYGEDTVWGAARDLKFSSGRNSQDVFLSPPARFVESRLPANAPIGSLGLRGAVWFETIYQDSRERSGKTLYAIYHNENYPDNFPYDSITRKGYRKQNWPEGLRGPTSPAAVCRIGIMKSIDGGWSWQDKGIFLEDLQPRMILKPY